MSDPKERDPIHQLAIFIFKMGRDVEALAQQNKRRVELATSMAWDKGYAAGRDDLAAELGLDERALLLKPKAPAGGTGAPNAAN